MTAASLRRAAAPLRGILQLSTSRERTVRRQDRSKSGPARQPRAPLCVIWRAYTAGNDPFVAVKRRRAAFMPAGGAGPAAGGCGGRVLRKRAYYLPIKRPQTGDRSQLHRGAFRRRRSVLLPVFDVEVLWVRQVSFPPLLPSAPSSCLLLPSLSPSSSFFPLSSSFRPRPA